MADVNLDAGGLLEEVIDASPDAILRTTLDGVITAWNAGAERLYGYPAEDVLGKSMFLIVPRERTSEHEQILERLRKGERILRMETIRRSKDRRSLHVSVTASPLHVPGGRRIGASFIEHDITELKRSEEALESGRRFLASTLDSLTAQIAILNAAGEIVAVNESWRRFAVENELRHAAYCVGESYLAVCDRAARTEPAAAETARAIRDLAAAARDTFSLDYPCHSPTEQRWFTLRASRFEIDGQRWIVVTHENVTDRRRAEEALLELNENLERRIEERTRSLVRQQERLRALAAELTRTEERERKRLAEILHDHLQQLLVAAKLRAQTARAGGAEKVDAGRMFAEIEDLMTRAIETSRTLTVELSPTVLYESGLAAALHWLGGWMEEQHGLAVTVEAESRDDPEDEEIRVTLFQAVRELLFNVVKHAGVREAHVSMSRANDERIDVVVEDHGKGFDPETLSREGSPTGFGLFNIRERLALLGGNLIIESRPGGGTRARIIAPRGRNGGGETG